MTLTSDQRTTLLSSWIKPSSTDEKTQQDRAQGMITDAVEAHPVFKGTKIEVYSKGSYANSTNVRRDSDVDIVVANHDCYYYDYLPVTVPASGAPTSGTGTTPTLPPYTGPWTPALWRSELTQAMINCFGASDVDTSGAVALEIAAVAGSRPSADVVPSFAYRRLSASNVFYVDHGSKVFKKAGGSITNWPAQQLANGRSKNTATGGLYKDFVRALKNLENRLQADGLISAVPSYFMECLVYNVPNPLLQTVGLDNGFKATLAWLYVHLADEFVYEEWLEPNGIKYLFHSSQKWSRDDGKALVLAAWKWMDY